MEPGLVNQMAKPPDLEVIQDEHTGADPSRVNPLSEAEGLEKMVPGAGCWVSPPFPTPPPNRAPPQSRGGQCITCSPIILCSESWSHDPVQPVASEGAPMGLGEWDDENHGKELPKMEKERCA